MIGSLNIELPVKTTDKVCVVTSSGNAGKTTISAYFLAPRLENAMFLSVESVNQSAIDWGFTNVEIFKGNQFGDIITTIVLEDDRPVVLDVGASNIESLFAAMGEFTNAGNEFDLFIVPAFPDKKSVEEGVKVIEQLRAMGVPPEKIYVLPNFIRTANPLTSPDLPALFRYLESTGNALFNLEVFLPENPVFVDLRREHLTIEDALDGTDYRALAKQAMAEGDRESGIKYAKRYTLVGLTDSLKSHLDRIFRIMWSETHG